jgi:hypothetical protein
MKTLQFEAIKLAMKQDREGYVLNLRMHPDEIPEDLLRDFVGARYQCVLVRLDGHDKPMNRESEYAGDRLVQMAGLMCRDPDFWQYLFDDLRIMDQSEKEAADWLRVHLGLQSRSDLRTNVAARERLNLLNEEFQTWKQEKS